MDLIVFLFLGLETITKCICKLTVDLCEDFYFKALNYNLEEKRQF